MSQSQTALNDEHLRLIQQLRDTGVDVVYEHTTSRGTGVGLNTNSNEVAAAIDFAAPTALANGAQASGGSALLDLSAVSPASAFPVLLAFGAVAILGGAALAIFKQWRAGLILASAGGVLIALSTLIGSYPWVLGVAGAVVLLGLGWFVWQQVRAANEHAALRAVVGVVDKVGGEVKETVKDGMRKRLGEDSPISDVIRKAKGS